MYDACMAASPDAAVIVMTAAVADYRPVSVASNKIKKNAADWELKLTKNEDILLALGKQKKAGQFIAGFALETNNEREHALAKLQTKNADMIVLNSLNDEAAGFGVDTNQVTILHRSGEEKKIGLQSKKAVAEEIVSFIITHVHAKP